MTQGPRQHDRCRETDALLAGWEIEDIQHTDRDCIAVMRATRRGSDSFYNKVNTAKQEGGMYLCIVPQYHRPLATTATTATNANIHHDPYYESMIPMMCDA